MGYTKPLWLPGECISFWQKWNLEFQNLEITPAARITSTHVKMVRQHWALCPQQCLEQPPLFCAGGKYGKTLQHFHILKSFWKNQIWKISVYGIFSFSVQLSTHLFCSPSAEDISSLEAWVLTAITDSSWTRVTVNRGDAFLDHLILPEVWGRSKKKKKKKSKQQIGDLSAKLTGMYQQTQSVSLSYLCSEYYALFEMTGVGLNFLHQVAYNETVFKTVRNLAGKQNWSLLWQKLSQPDFSGRSAQTHFTRTPWKTLGF